MTNKYSKTENRRNFYNDRFESQEGRCAICKRKERLVVDHDHATGLMRGLLCYKHNAALGMFDDNAEFLQAAANYLHDTDSHKSMDRKEDSEIYRLTERLISELEHGSDRARARVLSEMTGITKGAAQTRISRARRKKKALNASNYSIT